MMPGVPPTKRWLNRMYVRFRFLLIVVAVVCTPVLASAATIPEHLQRIDSIAGPRCLAGDVEAEDVQALANSLRYVIYSLPDPEQLPGQDLFQTAARILSDGSVCLFLRTQGIMAKKPLDFPGHLLTYGCRYAQIASQYESDPHKLNKLASNCLFVGAGLHPEQVHDLIDGYIAISKRAWQEADRLQRDDRNYFQMIYGRKLCRSRCLCGAGMKTVAQALQDELESNKSLPGFIWKQLSWVTELARANGFAALEREALVMYISEAGDRGETLPDLAGRSDRLAELNRLLEIDAGLSGQVRIRAMTDGIFEDPAEPQCRPRL